MGINRSIRLGTAGVSATLLTFTLLSVQPAEAVTAVSKTIQGSASQTQTKEWFKSSFDTGERFFGKLRGKIRFVTDTTATLSTTRTISSTERGAIDAGSPITTTISNAAVASRLQLTARPALQLIFEWQPQGDSYACDNTTFPAFTGDDWFMRRDDRGPIAVGVCGAIEVTADDLSRILQSSGIDLELPEAFSLLDQFFTAGFSGTQSPSQSHHLIDIKVCKMLTDTFGLPIGDHCDIEVNAVVTAPLTTLGHTLEAQLCMNGEAGGTNVDCLVPLEEKRSVTFSGTGTTYAVQAPCPAADREIDVRITDPAWNARLEGIALNATVDLNVHLTANGDGADVNSLPLPGSIPLLNSAMPLDVTYPAASSFVLHIGEVTPDDDAPVASLDPSTVTIDEGSSTTFTPQLADLCSATADLTATWSIDGLTSLVGQTLTRSYGNDLPNPVHNGTLVVTDEADNQTPEVPFSVTVRNVPPSVQVSGLPANPVARGTALSLGSQVTDPGADLETWTWSYGDGTSETRTAGSVADRTDSRRHTYAVEGLYSLQLGVHDGTDLRTTGGTVTVYDPMDRLVGSGTFKADRSSLNVPAGSIYSAQATVSYGNGADRPSGSFVSDFLISTGSNQTTSRHLVATSFEWIFENGLVSRTQGLATLNGQSGWKFQAEVTRTKVGAQTARIAVTVWRPGITTMASPDYRLSGPRTTGNIQ